MLKSLSRVVLATASGLLALPASAQEAAPVAGPANLCQELVAFVKVPEAKKQESATPASQATAVSNPSGQTAGKPAASGGEAPQTSGLSGGVETNAAVPSGDRKGALAQANSSAKAPAPPAPSPPAPKPDAATIAQIEAAAAINDQASCRSAARTMRKAGVPMPVPLLALSALDLKFQKAE